MTYRGLAIGGPLDGQYVEHTSNLLRIPQKGEVVLRSDGTRAAYQPNLWFNYLFCTRYWVPHKDGQSAKPITEVLDVLDRVYVESRKESDQ
jgi:hypothetical protein